jgi:hypothetical protein
MSLTGDPIATPTCDTSYCDITDSYVALVTGIWALCTLALSVSCYFSGQLALARRLKKLTPERAMEELLNMKEPYGR